MSTRATKQWTYALGYRYMQPPTSFGSYYAGVDEWHPLSASGTKSILRFKMLASAFPTSGATPYWSISDVQGHVNDGVLYAAEYDSEPIGITVTYQVEFDNSTKTARVLNTPTRYEAGWWNSPLAPSPSFDPEHPSRTAGEIKIQIPLYTLIDKSPNDCPYFAEAYPAPPAANMWFWVYQKVLQSGVGKNLYYARQVKRLTNGTFEWGGGGSCFVAANSDGRAAQLISAQFDGQAAISNYGANGSAKNVYLAVPVTPIQTPQSAVIPLMNYAVKGFETIETTVVDPIHMELGHIHDDINQLSSESAAIAKRAITL